METALPDKRADSHTRTHTWWKAPIHWAIETSIGSQTQLPNPRAEHELQYRTPIRTCKWIFCGSPPDGPSFGSVDVTIHRKKPLESRQKEEISLIPGFFLDCTCKPRMSFSHTVNKVLIKFNTPTKNVLNVA